MIESKTHKAAGRDVILEKLFAVYSVPSFTSIQAELNTLLNNPDTSAARLASVISRDAGLVARLLTVANSPFYSGGREIISIESAVILLGFDQVRNISLAYAFSQTFNRLSNPLFDAKQFSLHSLQTATMARKTALDFGTVNEQDAFTAGLLHDIGIPLMCKHFPREFQEVQDIVEMADISYYMAEKELLGITHAEIAAELFAHWNLPGSLITGVRYHHEPSKTAHHKELAVLLHIIDYTTLQLNAGEYFWDENYEPDENNIGILQGSNINYLDDFIDSYKEEFFRNYTSINN